MASSFSRAMNHAGILIPAVETQKVQYSKIYNEHCHRIYSLAFWMTDNELVADELAANAFLRAFSGTSLPGAEQIDQAFLAEVRDFTPVGVLTLNTALAPESKSIYGNVKRIQLERAVVQLPATEKLIFLLHDVEGYEHDRIGRLLGISADECKLGLHQARVSIRHLLARTS